MDKISVIVPVYNADKYIKRCLDSLITQTYRNLEILCIDDGSTDTSGIICDDYAKKDNRIRVFHTENRGVSTARNIGLDNFTGDYVGFVDSDDWIELEMYEKLYNTITSSGADIASCGFYFDSLEGAKHAKNIMDVPSTAIESRDFLKYIYTRDMYKGVSGYIVTRLFKSFLFKLPDNQKIRFCEELSVGEDVLLLAECHIKSKTTIFLDLPMYHYFQNPFSVMHSYEKRLEKLSSLMAYKRIIELYEKNYVDSSVIDLVKRFYVFRAGFLAEHAIRIGYYEKAKVLRKEIIQYLDVYEKTNSEFPERIEHIHRLLKLTKMHK